MACPDEQMTSKTDKYSSFFSKKLKFLTD